jgi:hypothetical protein
MSSESRERVERRPGFILAKLKAILTPIVAPEVLAIYADGLRKAGLPEERGVALVWRRHRIMRDAAKGEGRAYSIGSLGVSFQVWRERSVSRYALTRGNSAKLKPAFSTTLRTGQ